MSDDNEANVRRSKRIAAKDERPNLMDNLLDELDSEEQASTSTAPPAPVKKSTVAVNKNKKFYKSMAIKKEKDSSSGTLFDQGLKAVSILGATSVDDEAKGTNDICYLVKYDNGQFELVLNTVAHRFCPNLIIDFLESRIMFREKESSCEFSQELFADSNQLSHIHADQSQLEQLDHPSRSIEI